MKKKQTIAAVLLGAVIVLGTVGSVLWLGATVKSGQSSYFWGIWVIVAAIPLYLWRVLLLNGSEELRSLVVRSIRSVGVPIAGIVIAIVIGGILMLLTGYNPITAYGALFYGGLVRNWHISVLNAAPLIFTGLSIAVAFKAGLFNIGAEGQYYIGAMAAAWLGLNLNLPAVITLVLVFVIAGVLAAAWNIVPALLKVRTGAHEVITTMMLAHTARYLSPIFIRAYGGDPSTSTHPYVTDEIFPTNWLPSFDSFLPNANYRLHTGILVAIVVAIAVNYLIYQTKIGFEIRAVGQNKDAARAQGISIGRNIFRALLIAGFLAGLAGVNQVTGLDHKLFENLNANYGWNGISVALLAGGSPIGVIFTSLIWGILDAGGQFMSRTTQTPNAIVEIVKGIILFLVVAKYIYVYLGEWIKNRRKRSIV